MAFCLPEDFNASPIKEMMHQSMIHKAINLAQGSLGDPLPEEMKRAAMFEISDDRNQYSIPWGDPGLRNGVSEWMAVRYGIEYDPASEITITCGVSEAILSTLASLLVPGDSVGLFEPVFENYVPLTLMARAEPKLITPSVLEPGRPMEYEEESVKAVFESGIRAFVINNPNNPTGQVFDGKFLQLLRDLSVDHDVLAITDEVYSEYIYDGMHHRSIASLEGMRERTVVLNGASKNFRATGWRVGWACAPEPLTTPIRETHTFATICAPNPLQRAVAVGLKLGEAYYDEIVSEHESRRDVLLNGLTRLGFRSLPPMGAYYIFTSFEDIAPDLDSWEIARFLVADGGVGTVPASGFFYNWTTGGTDIDGRHWLRFAYSRDVEMLASAVEKIEERIQQL